MRSVVAIVTVLLALAALHGAHAGASPASVDECLRAHGWPYGLVGLRRAEIEHGHPNGLMRICHAPARRTVGQAPRVPNLHASKSALHARAQPAGVAAHKR